MDLTYIIRKNRNADDLPYERHFLIDSDSDRSWGYVDTPTAKEFLHQSSPFEGKTRYYTTLSGARGYLELSAIEQDLAERTSECEDLKSLSASQPIVAEEPKAEEAKTE